MKIERNGLFYGYVNENHIGWTAIPNECVPKQIYSTEENAINYVLATGTPLMKAPLPAGMEDTPEIRAKLQAMVEHDTLQPQIRELVKALEAALSVAEYLMVDTSEDPSGMDEDPEELEAKVKSARDVLMKYPSL